MPEQARSSPTPPPLKQRAPNFNPILNNKYQSNKRYKNQVTQNEMVYIGMASADDSKQGRRDGNSSMMKNKDEIHRELEEFNQI